MIEVFDSLDNPDRYDLLVDGAWSRNVSPVMAISMLRRHRNELVSQLNKVQRELDRLSLLELPYDDPRVDTPWPQYYELRVKE